MENLTDMLDNLDSLFNHSAFPCSGYVTRKGACVNVDYLQKLIHNYLIPKWHEVIFLILFTIVFVVGLLGNFLVCFVIWREHRMRTITNTFIFNLAFADFMVLFIVLPFTVIQDVFESWFLGDTGCKLMKYLQRVSVVVSVLTLTAIAIERFNAICYPLKVRATLVKARLTIVAIWIVAFGACIPELLFCQIERSYPEHITPYLVSCRNMKPLIGIYFYIVVFFLIPSTIIAFCYARIARCLWKSHIPIQSGNGDTCNRTDCSQPHLARRRTAKMLFVVVLFFFCCYLPVYIINTLFILQLTGVAPKVWKLNLDATVIITLCTHLLVYMNSAMNPIIYNFMSEKFRREFRMACSSCCGKSTLTAVELTEKRDNVTRTGTTRLVTTADNRGTYV